MNPTIFPYEYNFYKNTFDMLHSTSKQKYYYTLDMLFP